jgi:hypothetical protein
VSSVAIIFPNDPASVIIYTIHTRAYITEKVFRSLVYILYFMLLSGWRRMYLLRELNRRIHASYIYRYNTHTHIRRVLNTCDGRISIRSRRRSLSQNRKIIRNIKNENYNILIIMRSHCTTLATLPILLYAYIHYIIRTIHSYTYMAIHNV